MNTIGRFVLAGGALLAMGGAQAEPLSPIELERVVFRSMVMSAEPELEC